MIMHVSEPLFIGMRRDRPTFNQLIVGLKPEDEIVVTKLV